MAYTGDQAQSLDPNQPADSTQESTMPDYVRTLTAAFLGWLDVCHHRTGKHKRWFGVDSGAVNAYVITITHIITNLDAGIEFIFVPGVTNTGAATLKVIAAADVNLGTVNIKKGGNNVAAGDIVAATPVHVVYDGTNFLLINGGGAVTVTPTGGGMTLIDKAESGFTEATTTAPLGSVNLPTNSYTSIKVEAEILLRNNGSAQDFTLIIKEGATTRATTTLRVSAIGTTQAQHRIPMSVIFDGSVGASTISVEKTTPSVSNAGATLANLRIYGID